MNDSDNASIMDKMGYLHKTISLLIQNTMILIPTPLTPDGFTGKICELDSNNLSLNILEYLNSKGVLNISNFKDGK